MKVIQTNRAEKEIEPLFGEVIHDKREKLGYSQDELCEMLNKLLPGENIGRQSVSKWETKQKDSRRGKEPPYPRIRHLCALSIILNLSLDTMFEEELDLYREYKESVLDECPGMKKIIGNLRDL